MTVKDLIMTNKFKLINQGGNLDKDISGVFCCDLLSLAMSRAHEGCVWITVMANQNTLAVGTLVDASCIILAEGMTFDKPAIDKAVSEGLTIFYSDMPIYESAEAISQMIND